MNYAIKLISRDGKRGYVYDSTDGIIIIQNGYHPNITLFEDEAAAREFVKDKKLEKKGVRASIRTTFEMFSDKEFGELAPVNEEMYYIAGKDGQKVFHDTHSNQFFFRKQEIGFCVWNKTALDELTKLVDDINIDMPEMEAKIKKMSDHGKS